MCVHHVIKSIYSWYHLVAHIQKISHWDVTLLTTHATILTNQNYSLQQCKSIHTKLWVVTAVTEFLCNHYFPPCNGSQLCEQSCVDYFIVENICSKYLQDALQTIADTATVMCSQLPSNDCVTLTSRCYYCLMRVLLYMEI